MSQANCHSPAEFKSAPAGTNTTAQRTETFVCHPLHRITLHGEVIEAVIIPCDCTALSSEQPGTLYKRPGVVILALRGKAQTGICLKFPQGVKGTWELGAESQSRVRTRGRSCMERKAEQTRSLIGKSAFKALENLV